MRRYRLTLRHDSGVVRLTVAASSVERAVQIVCASERAPVGAVVKRERLHRN